MDGFNGFDSSSYQQDSQQQPKGFDAGNYQQQNLGSMMQQQYVNKNLTLNRDVVLTVLQFVIFRNIITGILSLIFTLTANDKFCAGLYQEYEKYTLYGRITRIVGYVLFVGILIFSMIMVSSFINDVMGFIDT